MIDVITLKYAAFTGDFVLKTGEYGVDISTVDAQLMEKNLHDYDLSKNSVLFDFLGTDIASPESILNFYKKYGLLDASDFSVNAHRLDALKKQVAYCRTLLNLYYAAINRNIVDTAQSMSILVYLYFDHISFLGDFLPLVRPFLDTLPKSHTRTYSVLNDRLFPRYVHNSGYKNASNKPTFMYDYLSGQLETAFSFNRYIDMLTAQQKDDMFNCSMRICSFVLSAELKNVHVEVLFRSGKLSICWIAQNLRSLIWYELAQRLIGGDIIRRCACKTCGSYYQIYNNDTRKIYCSTRCAQLEAKRKQRERQKKVTPDAQH